jgi:hypothetical protein
MSSNEDIAKLLDQIVWGSRIVDLADNTYVFRSLTLEERNIANYIYDTAIQSYKKRSLKSREELKKDVILRGLWKINYENDLKLLREELGNLTKQLEKEREESNKRRAKSSQLVRLERRIKYVTERLYHFEDLYARMIEIPSIEYMAERERGIYLLGRSTLNFPTMAQKWPRHEDILSESEPLVVNQLMNTYYKTRLIEEKSIRKIARSAFWRLKWNTCKKNRGTQGLFGCETYDLTSDQFNLVYWSMIYDSAFDSVEPPSDNVIEDDDMFDQWLEKKSKDRQQKQVQSELDKKVSQLSSRALQGQEAGFYVGGYYCDKCTCGMKEKKQHPHSPSCPYGVFLYYDKNKISREVEAIQSANPEGVRRLLAKEQKRLADYGEKGIEDQHLRKDVKTRALLGMSTQMHGPGQYGKK